MRYIIEIETAKELKDFHQVIDFLTWYLKGVVKIGEDKLKSIDVKRCDE